MREGVIPKPPPQQDDRGDRWLDAQYGEDARNPIMWALINAHTHLDQCNSLKPEQRLIDTLIDYAERLGRDSAHWGIRMGFFEAAAKAILAGDAEFFREVARLLESRIKGPPERRVDLAVNHAFGRLRRHEGKLPTKKQVREAALWDMAFSNVLQRKPGPNPWEEMTFFPSGNKPRRLKPSIIKEVNAEVQLLPEQNWTVIFKRCGLSNLPNDRGGQPSHRKRPYSQ